MFWCNRYIVCAVEGFFQAISRSGEAQGLQDTLRLLGLWFEHGGERRAEWDVEASFLRGFSVVPVDTWLSVIPQIIARINSSIPSVRRMVSPQSNILFLCCFACVGSLHT